MNMNIDKNNNINSNDNIMGNTIKLKEINE